MGQKKANKLQTVKGMHDMLPPQSRRLREVERRAHGLLQAHGYAEVRTPIVEYTPLFARSIGEVTDIVEKEMYTFRPGTKSSVSLRPEGTAGIVRAYLEAGYAKTVHLQRFFHIGPMFRHERPQASRDRMFTQFDVEALGSLDPRLDAEVVHLAASFFEELGIEARWRRGWYGGFTAHLWRHSGAHRGHSDGVH